MSNSWLCNSNVANTKGKITSVNILCSVQQRNSRCFSCHTSFYRMFTPHQPQIQRNELCPKCPLLHPTHLVHIIHIHLLLQRNFQKLQTHLLSNHLQRQMKSGIAVNSLIRHHQKLERNSWRAGLCLGRSVQAMSATPFLLSDLRMLEVCLVHERCERIAECFFCLTIVTGMRYLWKGICDRNRLGWKGNSRSLRDQNRWAQWYLSWESRKPVIRSSGNPSNIWCKTAECSFAWPTPEKAETFITFGSSTDRICGFCTRAAQSFD